MFGGASSIRSDRLNPYDNNESIKPNQDCAAVFEVKKDVDFGKIFAKAITGIDKKLRKKKFSQQSGAAICGVGVKKTFNEETKKTEIKATVGNLGDSGAFLIFDRGEGAPKRWILFPLSEDFGFENKRFTDKEDLKYRKYKGVNRVTIIFEGEEYPGINMSGALGDFDSKLLKDPDIFEYSSGNFPVVEIDGERIDLNEIDLTGSLVISDAYTKAPDDWVPGDADALTLTVDNSGEKVFKHISQDYGKAIGKFSDKSFVGHIADLIDYRDDNSAAFIDFEEMNDGQSAMAWVLDGHGEFGHEVAKEGIKSLCNYGQLVMCQGAVNRDEERVSPEVRGFWNRICGCFGRLCGKKEGLVEGSRPTRSPVESEVERVSQKKGIISCEV